MQIKDIVRKLKEYNQDSYLVIFAECKIYPTLDIYLFENEVEFDCGWEDIKEKE
jgi:hypothetical protein